jgi:hypothetical protein
MTQGLYELLGAERAASREALRAAYTRTVAQLVRRRRTLVEQGGDPGTLDLRRARIDEAWAVLADPVRRRRYDALLALTASGEPPDPEALWSQVAGALSSPAAAAAVEVVRRLTDLQVGALPAAAGTPEADPTEVDPARGRAPDTQADVPTESVAFRSGAPAARARPAAVGGRPDGGGVPTVPTPRPTLQVVQGRDSGAPVVHLPSSDPAAPSPPRDGASVPDGPAHPSDPGALVARYGWSGALLRAVREARGLSLRDMGEATRISARYLEAIEADDHAHLPSITFVKGYLREMARTLDLDEAALVKGYMRRMDG